MCKCVIVYNESYKSAAIRLELHWKPSTVTKRKCLDIEREQNILFRRQWYSMLLPQEKILSTSTIVNQILSNFTLKNYSGKIAY